ncbi:unnamed protein product [Mytilus coruscus]|uniref:Uncharacterized protein n=1 Tax=Mytilus coruscus TaxID=42192 RepID=A0A6J8D148_MYTCO|nr:unnamed protein product [Mytilus coruscus]
MEFYIPRSTSPGILYPVLNMLRNQQNDELMLCADEKKKVTAGVDGKGGDVDMIGFEDGITFQERKTQLEEQINILNEITNFLLSKTASDIIGTQSHYVTESTVDISYQENHVSLMENDESVSTLEPRYLKQRSDVWHILRKSTRVTGSTLHSALGLRGLKE